MKEHVIATPLPAPGFPKRSFRELAGWGLLLAVLAASWNGADMRPGDLFRDAGNMATYAADFFPPNFRDWRIYLHEMLITLQIAIWGTALAIVLAIPCGLLCSANIVPWWIYQPMRRLMDAARAINEMVFAMLFVVAVGLGPFAGVLALFISYSLYRFESNVRSATVVGMVGAGGIGVVLWEIIRGFAYAETCAVMIMIVITVSLIDLLSARIRKLFI